MKKIIIAMATIAAVLAMASCSKELVEPGINKEGVCIITASTESSITKTALSGTDAEGYQVVWSEGDRITIGSETFTIDNDGVGRTSAQFTCATTPAQGDYNALYAITELVWPSTQTYQQGKITNAPMYASATVDEDGKISPLSFKNLGGLLRLTVKGESTRRINHLEIVSNTMMAGPFTIRNDAARITNKTSRRYSIVLDCGPAGVALSDDGTEFFIAMPGGFYGGVKISLFDTEGNVCIKNFKGEDGLTITRSEITPAAFTARETDFVPAIMADSPVGMVGMLNGVEGMVVELNGKKTVVATMNYGATTIDGGAGSADPEGATCYGSYIFLGFASALAQGHTMFGWRLPTSEEMDALAEKITWSDDRHGAVLQVTETSTLFLPAAGYHINQKDEEGVAIGYTNVGTFGSYAGEKTGSVIEALEFDANETNVSNYLYNVTTMVLLPSCSVRLFHDMPAE